MNCPRPAKACAALLTWLFTTVALAQSEPRLLIVDLTVNHRSMGDTFVLQGDGDDFYVDDATLNAWEIARPWPVAVRLRGGRYYRLNEFAGTTADYNERDLTLAVVFPAALMPTRTVDLRERNWAKRSEDYGAFLDYEVSLLDPGANLDTSMYGLLRPTVFGKFGNLSSNVIYQDASPTRPAGWNVIDLTWSWDDPESMRSIRAGDVITNPGGQGSPVRIGGLQVATNFATQPTFITYPLPEFYGQSEVPSALDIYVNGRLSRRQEVQPGSYVLQDIPVINGLGQMQVIATDALGRQQVFTQDFYLSTDLLMEGLSDYSITVGAVREQFGLENFRYGDLAGSGTWRYGVSDELTVTGHGEFSEDVAMVGGSMTWGINQQGTISAGAGVSNGDLGTGTRWQLGYQRRSNFLNLNFDVSGASDRFDVIGSTQLFPKLQFVSAIGKSFHEYGSLGFSVVHQEYHDRPRRTIWSIDYSRRMFHRVSMSAQLSYLDAIQNDLMASVRFNVNFGTDHSARGGISTSRAGSSVDAAIQRNMPMNVGYGYHFAAGAGDIGFIDTGAAVQTDYGAYSADLRYSDANGTSWQAGTRGSIAVLGGMTSFSRQVNEAFAVVNVGNFEGVRVYAENLEIGRTDENGQIFVPGLRPFVTNQLRIELDDLPLNARIGDVNLETTPYNKSGVIVNFDVSVSTNVLFRVVRPDGTPLPEGAIAHVYHTGDDYPVGKNGKLYLQGIDRSSEVEIRWHGRICDLDVPYPTGNAIIARMGDIVCIPRPAQ